MTYAEAVKRIAVWNFIPYGWEVPLGFDDVVAGAKEALAVLRRAEKVMRAVEDVAKQDLKDDVHFMENPMVFETIYILRAALLYRNEEKKR